jgi:hypothetical protein
MERAKLVMTVGRPFRCGSRCCGQSPAVSHRQALAGRVEDWRAGPGRVIPTMPRLQPPPRRTQRADFPHCAPHSLHAKAYGTYPAKATFGPSRRTR